MPLEDLDLPLIWAEQRAWKEEREKRFKAVEPVIQQTMLRVLADNSAGVRITRLVEQTTKDMASNPTLKENTDFFESDVVRVFQYLLFTGQIIEGNGYLITLPKKTADHK